MAKGYGANKETEKMIRKAKSAGWTVEITRGNHLRFLPPDNGPIIIAGLTSSTSGVLQTRKRLRKAGLCV
jgi:predicted RNA binding protein YcfA (HicA-like mRNA interferase family)